MKQTYRIIFATLFLVAFLSVNSVFSQTHANRPGQTVAGLANSQAVVQQPVQTPLPAPVVVNFQQLADSALLHPVTPVNRFIEQEEDRDANFKFTPRTIPAGAPVANIPVNTLKSLINSPAPLGSWNGTMQNQQLIPPDIRGAASSGNWVMETNNEQFDIWNKTGTHLSTLDIPTFFNASGGSGYFDPHILYDNNYNRFIVCIDGNTSNGDGGLFVAVSQTNDPTGSWYVYTIDDGDNNSNDLLDYPLMGYNTNWVVLSANLFVGNTPTTKIYVLNRANLYSGTQGTTSTFTDNTLFTVGPAQTYGIAQTTEYLVTDANGNQGGNGYMQVGTITGTPANPVYTSGSTIGVSQAWDENTVAVPQSGGTTIEDGDTRTGNAVYINGSLWFTHTVFLPAGNPTHAGVDWWQINPASLTVQQFGRIQDASGSKFYFYPSINVNSNGDALLGYCESSSSMFASAAYAFRAGTDALNTMQSDNVYKSGVANYVQTLGGGRNRWGDFTGTAVDPADGSFWNFSEWANSGNQWATVVAHIAAATPVTVPPVTNFTADVTTTCSGLVQFTDLSSGNPTSWLWHFGDGTTSALQNPSHLYTATGTYTVQLTATNAYGSTPKSIANYITVSKPAGPAASNVSHCGTSTFSLSANTTNHVSWLDSTGAVVSTVNPFVTPNLTHTTTYWVQDTIPNAASSVGPVSYTALSATGGYFSNSTDRYLTFDATSAFTLVSVTAYAQAAGSRIIEFRNSGGTVLQSATVNMAAGTNVVTLNFNIPVGTGYELGINGTANLYRNNDGGTVNYYPFTLPGVVSITGSNAGAGYYYYFYNWQVQSGYCLSQATAVSAVISSTLVVGAGSVTNVTCHGLANGSATISVSGGTPSYTYQWSNGQSGITAVNLASGTYVVTITDASSCSITTSKTVSQPSAINISVTPTNAGCGATDGSAVANVTGGTSGYTYNWNTGATSNTVSNLGAGTYTLTVTDAANCTATASTIVNSSGSLNVVPSGSNVTCHGASTGSVTISVSGSTGTVTYAWSNGGNTQSINNVPAGVYTVTVSDASGCSAIASRTVTEPAALTVNLVTTNAGCGTSNGTATANVSGGTSGYSYSWSNGGGNADVISNLAAGSYSVTVIDSHSCSISAAAAITNASSLVAALSSTNATCFGATNGTANANVTSGTSPFTYAWSAGGNSASISNLSAGTYFVTITDGNNCPQRDSVIVSQPTAIVLNVNEVAPTCHGNTNGSASVTASGGNPSYTFTWFNNATGSSINNLGAGNYAVTAVDVNSCSAASTFTVTDPAAINVIASTANDSCYGDQTGSVQITTAGGTAPFSYSWSNGSSASQLTGLSAGTYTITITDSHSCSVTSSTSVSQPGQLQVHSSSTDDNGTGNGTASVDSISGGNGPYTVLHWSNGETTNPAVNLAAGTYTVTITDHNGCIQTGTVVVSLSTGINNVSGDLSFSIFPNPARTEIVVELSNNISKETTLNLQDVLGQTLVSTAVSANQTKVDLAPFSNGVYFIVLKQGDKRVVKKFVISR